MFCPCCKEVNLVMSERQGIEIDYCPQCRGVWLDRGELDKMIEKATLAEQQSASQARAPQTATPPQGGYSSDDHRYRDQRYHKPRKSFWMELFD